MAQNPYLILGVAPDAEPQQITRAFRRLVRTLHPDAAPDMQAAGGQGTRERFEQVVAAYHVLHDPDARATYDQGLAATVPTADHGPGPGPHVLHQRGQAPLVAGPTVIHARTSAASQTAISLDPPTGIRELDFLIS